MATREERLKVTQKAYERWSENIPFITDYEASNEDESDFVGILCRFDPELGKGLNTKGNSL